MLTGAMETHFEITITFPWMLTIISTDAGDTARRFRRPDGSRAQGSHTALAMFKNGLRAFWISFPSDPEFPMGFGVTAWSQADAYCLLESNGYTFHLQAKKIRVREDVQFPELDQRHVVPNMGPIVVRGVWYPALNVGFGAP